MQEKSSSGTTYSQQLDKLLVLLLKKEIHKIVDIFTGLLNAIDALNLENKSTTPLVLKLLSMLTF
jgi:hypothetical protein